MTIALLIYIVSMLPELKSATGAVAFFGSLASVCLIIGIIAGAGIEKDYKTGEITITDSRKLMIKFAKWIVPLTLFAAVMNVAIPKEKTAWLMLGGYVAQTVYQSEEGVKYRNIIMKKIDEAIGEKTESIISTPKKESK